MENIKQISIGKYLERKGIKSVKNYGHYAMYHCPFRDDHTASFKVDFAKNLWHDFGTGEGGSIIDLVMNMENLSFHEAVTMLECSAAYMHTGSRTGNFSFHRDNFSEKSPSNRLLNVIPITHPKLVEYVAERKIPLDLANNYCREIHYQNPSGKFFSVGFGNDNGGYELSSPNGFKSCISPKVIKTFRNDTNSCLAFEGFWDFLSYLTFWKINRTKHDVVVLNSIANIQKAMGFLKSHLKIYAFFDNDDAKRKTIELIKSVHSNVSDCSKKYVEFKDLNDFLRGKKQVLQQPKKRGIRL
jgi:hypothetical protein